MGATELPEYGVCWDKEEASQKLTALEQFVLHNEPAGREDEKAFREVLQAVIDEIEAAARQDEREMLSVIFAPISLAKRLADGVRHMAGCGVCGEDDPKTCEQGRAALKAADDLSEMIKERNKQLLG